MNKKFFVSILSFFIFSSIVFTYFVFFKTNIKNHHTRLNFNGKHSYDTLWDVVREKDLSINIFSLKVAAQFFKLRKKNIKQGSYKIDRDLSNFDFLNKLTKGEQDPVIITISQYETKEELAKYISSRLMLTEETLLQYFNDEQFLKRYGVDKMNVLNMFLANTYYVYWNISVQKFFDKMYNEFKNFWTPERLRKANDIGLTSNQVMILASIVQKEIIHPEEASIIAGVFINRLNKNMRLQSDPTTFYAQKYDPQPNDDYSFMRGARSKFNTYRYGGLPIGPICTPSLNVIDAVLNYDKHDFLFFVTAPDRSHHLFSQTFQGHRKNINFTFKKKRN